MSQPRPIPRDLTCWFCQRDQHARCPLTQTCACRVCYQRHPVPLSMPISPCLCVVRAIEQDGAK